MIVLLPREAALRNQPIRDFRLRVEGVRLSMGRLSR
jgi:hypothetical protein